MLSIRKILKPCLLICPRKVAHLTGVHQNLAHQNHFLYASFCAMPESSRGTKSSTIVESPELPNWFKYRERDNPSDNESDDDFVLPKVAEWAESRKLGDPSKLVKHIAAEIVDSDLTKLYDILKASFDSVEAVGKALSVCDRIELSESLVQTVLLKFRHNWVPAYGFFNWAKYQIGYKHTENCYNFMVNILGMSRNFEMMWELIKEMTKLGGLVSLATMTPVLRRLAKCGKYDEAVEAFDRFERCGVKKETAAMNILIEALVKERNVELAQKVYLELKNKIQPDMRTFNILVHGWTKAQKCSEAEQAMLEMKQHGFQPDVYSYTCFVEHYCRIKDFRKVDGILDEMEEKGCSPNVVTYTILMRALGEARETNEALEVSLKMKQSGCIPDANFYSALIHILSNSGRFKDARNLFEEMPEGVPNVLTYNTMISAACKHSSEEYAIQLLKEMELASCKPNLKTYTPLLKMCCMKKWMKVLDYLVADMFTKSVSLDVSTYCLLVVLLCESGKLEHACSYFEQMVLKGMVPQGKTYTLLMRKLEQKAMWNAKQQIENLMFKAKQVPMWALN